MKDIAKGLVFIGVFAIPFIPLIIANSMFFPFITGKNFTFRIIVEIIFAAWVILALYEPVYRPKFSWIVAGFTALLVVMAVSNALGADPRMSFWSNFERMEGYVTLVHTFMYLLVMGSVLTTDKLWTRFFNTTLFSAVLLSLYAFAQLSGNITINQGGWRLDGTLGNSAYMAIYMLFIAFITLLLFVRTEAKGWRYTYGALGVLFVYLLIQTATRGTILGLVGGLVVTTAYIAFSIKDHPRVRKVATGALLTLIIIVGLFIGFRKSEFIQQNPYLGRVANITLSEGSIRFKIWHMAYEGFKERPLLGWGQSNFNYIFNKQYDPSLYAAEAWYDRVHDIVFDWLVAGGILGFTAYFSIFFAALYYLLVRPILKHDEAFTVVERGVLICLLLWYLFHNLFVFDNIVSYMFYGTMLAFIHSRIGTPIPSIASWKIDTRIIEQVVSPIIVIVLFGVVYYVNVPGIQAASGLIDAFASKSPEVMLAKFDTALARNSFGNQEIREQMTRQAQNVIQSKDASEELKQKFFKRTEEELLKEVAEKPDDARVQVFISSFYRMTNNLDSAIEHLKIARDLSPKKQQIIFEQGIAYLQKKDYETAVGFFKDAYELAPSYDEARVYYGVSLLYAGKPELVDAIITEQYKETFAASDMALQAAYSAKDYTRMKEMFALRIAKNPTDTQLRTNLAFVLNESGDLEGAIASLNKAAEDIPTFADQAKQFIASLLMGKNPGQAQNPQVEVNGQKVEVKKP